MDLNYLDLKKKIELKTIEKYEIEKLYCHCKQKVAYDSYSFLLILYAQTIQQKDNEDFLKNILNLLHIYSIDKKCETEKSEIYFAQFNLYFILNFTPKIIEYGLKYEKSINEALNPIHTKKLYQIYNIFSVKLNDIKAYKKALYYAQKSFKLTRKVDRDLQLLFEIIKNNNSLYLYLKLDQPFRAKKYLEKLLQIIENNPENHYAQATKISINFTSLYFQIFSKDHIEKDDLLMYITYMEKRMKNEQTIMFESFIQHIEVIKLLIKYNFINESITFLEFFLNSASQIGDRKTIYKLLLDCLNQTQDQSEKSFEKRAFYMKEYLTQLEFYVENYNSALIDLTLEQFRIFDLECNYKTVKKNSIFDSLTNCYNRFSLEEDAPQFIKEYNNGSLIFLDLNELKIINDVYGHLTGDKALKKLVYVIHKVIKDQGNLYRYGGDEFVILLRTNMQEGILLLNLIFDKLQRPFVFNKEKIKIDFAYGIVDIEKNASLNKLILDTDKKMYKNKLMKKNQ